MMPADRWDGFSDEELQVLWVALYVCDYQGTLGERMQGEVDRAVLRRTGGGVTPEMERRAYR